MRPPGTIVVGGTPVVIDRTAVRHADLDLVDGFLLEAVALLDVDLVRREAGHVRHALTSGEQEDTK